MSRFVTTKGADGSSSASGSGITSQQLHCQAQWTCLIHCYPWTQDYGNQMIIKLPWGCYDGFDVRFNGFKHRNCCYENNYCFMPEWDNKCLCDSMQYWMCHYCQNCFARGSWETEGRCHTFKTTQCCCTSGYSNGCVAFNVRFQIYKDGTRNCDSQAITDKATSMNYNMCHWNHCDNFGCAIGKWGVGCIHCLVQHAWPSWCCGPGGWTGLYISNSCGYMEPYNSTMAYWSVYGMRNPNITGTGTPAPGYKA